MPRPIRSNPQTKHRAIELRTPALAGGAREESTPAEQRLWSRIRNDQLGVTFRRQHAIGSYIPDFYCPKAKLVIELDGSQHLEQEEYDAERTEYLESRGFKVIHFWNNDVMKDIDGVIRAIMQVMESERHL
jgi:very-short-patch-repair endonuclease